jgi:hypothetical protein
LSGSQEENKALKKRNLLTLISEGVTHRKW